MSATVAIMQPYVFPYLGYFSLVAAADVFVFYDDVNYIPRGWINRNRVLINGLPHTFTMPVANASQNDRILDVRLHAFGRFRDKFFKQMRLAYARAPNFEAGFAYVESVLKGEPALIAQVAIDSVTTLCQQLGIERRFLRSSQVAPETHGMDKAGRLAAITRALGSTKYVNALGGTALYDKPRFATLGVELSFVSPRLGAYPQGRTAEFTAGLSIIDVLMNNPAGQVARMIGDYELV
ncbi:MAG: WbqC family protein [Rhodocyclales bacterium]|nr:WbqC family protein [Rhodocyclales bacterium]